MIRSHELFIALHTLESFFSRMCSSVSLQFVWSCEPFSTKKPIANKRSFARMPPENITMCSNWKDYSRMISYLKCALKCEVFPYTLLHPGIWHICCFFLSECLSPSAQLGQVHATLLTLCFCMLSLLSTFWLGLLSGSGGVDATTIPEVMLVGWVVCWAFVGTLDITCHLFGSLGSCWMCWPTEIWGAWVITCTFPKPGIKIHLISLPLNWTDKMSSNAMNIENLMNWGFLRALFWGHSYF